MNIPVTYWRSRIGNDNAFRDKINTLIAIFPGRDSLLKVYRRHSICLASYDHATSCGCVCAVGLVTGSGAANRRLRVNWISIVLHAIHAYRLSGSPIRSWLPAC